MTILSAPPKPDIRPEQKRFGIKWLKLATSIKMFIKEITVSGARLMFPIKIWMKTGTVPSIKKSRNFLKKKIIFSGFQNIRTGFAKRLKVMNFWFCPHPEKMKCLI